MKYDFTGVTAALLNHEIPDSERAELFKACSGALQYPTKPLQLIVTQVASEALKQPVTTPETVVRIGIIYGMMLGILAERDKNERDDEGIKRIRSIYERGF